MPINLKRPALIKLTIGGTSYNLSDHNREPVAENRDTIEKTQRMANGTMRKYVVATKKSYKVSYTMLPGLTADTVDGNLGAMNLRSLYDSNIGKVFNLKMYAGSASAYTQPKVNTSQTLTTDTNVFISDFSCTIQKRLGGVDYWDVTIDFVEV